MCGSPGPWRNDVELFADLLPDAAEHTAQAHCFSDSGYLWMSSMRADRRQRLSAGFPRLYQQPGSALAPRSGCFLKHLAAAIASSRAVVAAHLAAQALSDLRRRSRFATAAHAPPNDGSDPRSAAQRGDDLLSSVGLSEGFEHPRACTAYSRRRNELQHFFTSFLLPG